MRLTKIEGDFPDVRIVQCFKDAWLVFARDGVSVMTEGSISGVRVARERWRAYQAGLGNVARTTPRKEAAAFRRWLKKEGLSYGDE